MGNFESFRTEATVTVDSKEMSQAPGKDEFESASEYADNLLAKALAKDLKEAAEVTGTRDSFILTMEL